MPEVERDSIALLEQECGQIETATCVPSVSGVQIVLYSPDAAGNRVMSSLGLHRYRNTTAHGKTPVSLELIVELAGSSDIPQLAGILERVVSEIASRRIPAPSRGSYLPIPPQSYPDQGIAGVYFTNPILRSRAFRDRAQSLSLVIAWMIPITLPELNVLETAGWTALESHWDEREDLSLRTTRGR